MCVCSFGCGFGIVSSSRHRGNSNVAIRAMMIACRPFSVLRFLELKYMVLLFSALTNRGFLF